MITPTISPSHSFQCIIELVETLTSEEQDLLFDLVHKRRILNRRQEIPARSIEAQLAFTDGTAKIGTAEDAIADLFGDDDE